MAYSDFNLAKVKQDLHISLVENNTCFADIAERDISEYLINTLQRNVPLALAINTEKARSELIVINILLEVREQLSNQISLFSGIDFKVDPEQGLNGYCDYILSNSVEQLYLETPVVAIVEAKNESITMGLGQCIAEMYAAQLYNAQAGANVPCTYGAVTTGNEWRFIKLQGHIAYIDYVSYYITEIKKIIGILVSMANGTKI